MASGFAFFENYAFLAGDPSFWPAIINTLIFIGSVLLITVVFSDLGNCSQIARS
jgi:sorbitol/mannitol transport system permease protein